MRYHLLSLPRALVGTKYNACAFTQKIHNLYKMMKAGGYDVVLYGTEGGEVDEVVFSTKDFKKFYKKGQDKFFTIDNKEANDIFNKNCIIAIENNRIGDDTLLFPFGILHLPIKQAFQQMTSIETGIGYHDPILNWNNHHRIYESYAQKNFVQGQIYAHTQSQIPSVYDTVIPNYYDKSQFQTSNPVRKDFFLFVGRGVWSKGRKEAIETTNICNTKIKLVGQEQDEIKEYIKTKGYTHAECLGVKNIKERNKLMTESIATICFTHYQEPFCGVKTESYLNGTPVISSDNGVFNEDVFEPIGTRCKTYQGLIEAINKYKDMSNMEYSKVSRACREFGDKFTTENIRPYYDDYFKYIEEAYKKQSRENNDKIFYPRQ